MKTRARELVAMGDGLFANRRPLDSLWQQLAENFHPMRADITRQRYFSEEFASYLMTGRPAMAHRDFSNLISALMRPRGKQWLYARTHDDRLNRDREARAYLDWMSELQFRAMYEPRAMLTRSCKEADGDYSLAGNAILTVEPNEWRDGMLIRCWHFRDVVFTENNALKIDCVHHKRKDSARDLCRLFPKTVDPKVTELKEKTPYQTVETRRIVIPSDEYDLPVRNKARFPFVAILVDIQNQVILEEMPQRSLCYVIPRWVTVSGSQYAYSPAAVLGLPDGRMLQQMTLTLLEAGQKSVDPPLKAVGEVIQGGINTGAGMITNVDADYDERSGPALEHLIQKYDGLEWGARREELVQANIDNTWYLSQLRFPQVTKDMTAYEAQKLYEQFTQNALPVIEPIEDEYNAALCTAAFEVGQTLHLFGDPRAMPEALMGQDVRWEFDTPLKAAQEQAKVFSFSSSIDAIAKGMQIDPNAALVMDVLKGTRDAVIGNGGADWLVDDDKVQQLIAQRQQQEAAQQTANQMAHGADAATRVATAAKAAGDAGQSLQQAGMT